MGVKQAIYGMYSIEFFPGKLFGNLSIHQTDNTLFVTLHFQRLRAVSRLLSSLLYRPLTHKDPKTNPITIVHTSVFLLSYKNCILTLFSVYKINF